MAHEELLQLQHSLAKVLLAGRGKYVVPRLLYVIQTSNTNTTTGLTSHQLIWVLLNK